MKIRVLGSAGADAQTCRCITLLVNDTLLLDAGTITTVLFPEEQLRITSIFISHAHLDHIKDLAFLSETRAGVLSPPVSLISTRPVLQEIKRYIFNGRIWPDFTQIPSRSRPVFRLRPIPEGVWTRIAGIRAKAIRVGHGIPAVGFLISDGASTLLYGGNTGSTERLWKTAQKVKTLKAAMIEVSFPNRLQSLSQISYHLTPSLLREELKKINRPDLAVYACHMKPPFIEEIRNELAAISPPVRLLTEGETLEI